MRPIDQLSDEEWQQLAALVMRLPDAPQQWVRAATALWQARAAVPASRTARVRLLAVLGFDSWLASPMAAGMRGAATDVRRLVYSAQGLDIDLRIEPAAETFELSGQVLGGRSAGLVELACLGASGAGVVRRVPLDELSEFHFDAVGPGSYEVTVRFEDLDVVLPPVSVAPRPDPSRR